ncbi:hypothetical protein U9M48_032523 [Paspalum notatum var. saurae]|uniref:Protein kinase domain-containing protein n=1 Tax=Paspalum notatum var. saurae TaxID=547442 RepID=A0AAQ3U4X4_PASNO
MATYSFISSLPPTLSRATMMLPPDPVSLAFKAAVKIKNAVEQFKRNDRECARIYAFVDTLSNQLRLLEEAPIRAHPKVRPTIERLKDALESMAAEAERCKSNRSALLRILTADDIAAKLDRLRKDISDEMRAAVVVATTNTNLEVQGIRQDMGQGFVSLHQHMDEVFYNVLSAFLPVDVQQQLERSTQVVGSADDAANHVASTGLPKCYCWSDVEAAIASSSDRYNEHYKNNTLGGGSSSSVYQAKLGNEPVAIKNFVLDEVVRACFVRELQLVLKLQHPNIVKLLGYCFEYKESLVVNANNGRVQSYKTGGLGEQEHVVWSSVLKIIQGIAEGVRYLHHQTVVHLDLKPENILLDAEMTPKITNFGQARELEHGTNEITVENFHIGGIKASEQQLKASTKCDVYSFGVILLETIGLKCSAPSKDDKRPIGPQDWDMRLQESELRDLFDRKRVTGEPQQRAARWCVMVGLMCCLPDPANRPSMGRVIDMLGWCMQEEITGIKKNQVTPATWQESSSSLIPEGYSTSITTFARDDERKYKVLTEDMLRQLQEDATKEVMQVMQTLENPRRGLAELLLRHSSWSPNEALNTWCELKDELDNVAMKRSSEELQCSNNCRGKSIAGTMISAGCSHYCCRKCWRQEVHKALVGQWRQLSLLKCPEPSCQVPVTRELVEAVANAGDKAEYNRLVLRSYVDDSGGRIKWCPADCGRAVEFLGGRATADSKDGDVFCGSCWRT